MKLFTYEKTLHDLAQQKTEEGSQVVVKVEGSQHILSCSDGTIIRGDLRTMKISVEKP